jgi:copper(I)-binding protein
MGLLAAAAAIALGGCAGTGTDAQTNAQYQAGIGANVRTGTIQLYNALAVDNGDGTATFSAAILNRDDAAAKLTGASAKASDGSKVDATTAPAIIDAGQLFNLGKTGAVILTNEELAAGDYVTVKLAFNGGRTVSVEAPVVARTAIYDGVATNAGGDSAATTSPDTTVPAGAPEPAEPATH